MILPSIDLDARGIARLCALGWPAFLAMLLGGGLVTAVSVLKVEPHAYKRKIIVNLAAPQTGGQSQQKSDPRPLACDIALGLRSDKDTLPQFERELYAQAIRKHRSGELGVTELGFFEGGDLAFKVSVPINSKSDPRIARLIDDLNVARSSLVKILQQRIKETEYQSELLTSSIGWIGPLEGEAASRLSGYLSEKLECVRYELKILQTRLSNSRTTIPYPNVLNDLMATSPLKTLMACIFATLLTAFLAALVTGYIRLLRELRSAKSDVVKKIKS